MDYEKIYNLFKLFINDIIKVFPEYEERLTNSYDDILINDSIENNNDKINDFLTNLERYNELIVNKNDKFFNCDPIIISNVSFKVIWDSNISDNTREKLWKYLQTFCMLKISIESNDKINEYMNDLKIDKKIKDKEVIKNIKDLKKLNKSINKNENKNENQNKNKNENEEKNNDNDLMKGINDILDNTNIGKIAKEITNELNVEELASNGNVDELFKGDKIMDIFSMINNKIEGKLSDTDKNDLVQEAGDICNNMKGNDLFDSILGNFQNKNMKNINLNNNNNSSGNNKTRDRLQRKLKDKQKQKLNVEKLN